LVSSHIEWNRRINKGVLTCIQIDGARYNPRISIYKAIGCSWGNNQTQHYTRCDQKQEQYREKRVSSAHWDVLTGGWFFTHQPVITAKPHGRLAHEFVDLDVTEVGQESDHHFGQSVPFIGKDDALQFIRCVACPMPALTE